MNVITGLSSDSLFRAVSVCAALQDVRDEVLRNHDDNRWWPRAVSDWRLRMIIAGWSARVSYSMVGTYRSVIYRADTKGYDALVDMPDDEALELVKSIGLAASRVRYMRSVIAYLESSGMTKEKLDTTPNDVLVKDFAGSVNGAGYKVAQCAVLYAKGYHCGIFPVDSGMKEMLGPCLGIQLPSGPISHEIMRRKIEILIRERSAEYRQLAFNLGYGSLSIPDEVPPIWWVHLVLIYFKRQYCNRHTPQLCPLRRSALTAIRTGSMCAPDRPTKGGTYNIVLEGVDRVGKSTIASTLAADGYSIVHSGFKADHTDIVNHHMNLVRVTSPTVLDRCFISEEVYGPVIRGASRFRREEFSLLAQALADNHFCVIYVEESVEKILERLSADRSDHEEVIKHLPALLKRYNDVLSDLARFVPVIRISPSTLRPHESVASRIGASLGA